MDKTNKCGGGRGTYSNTLECVLGRRHPLSMVLFLIQGNVWAGELWDPLHCAEKDTAGRSTSLVGFGGIVLVWKQFSCP